MNTLLAEQPTGSLAFIIFVHILSGQIKTYGKSCSKKNGKKKGENVTLGGGGVTPNSFFSQNLPGHQNTRKLTFMFVMTLFGMDF